MKKFSSDNNAPVHEKIMNALCLANASDVDSYGYDPLTKQAEEKVQSVFESNPEVYFVALGTAANVIGLAGLLRPFDAVLCAEEAHINIDECGAFERLTGNKIIQIPSVQGKITPEMIQPYLANQHNEHRVHVRVISISNVTETGTLYTTEEIQELGEFCRANDLYLHLDGARIANAAEKLGVSIADLTEAAGVDVLSFGGTKNGMMFGEAIVVFDRAKSNGYKYLRKQFMQLFSKHRYLSAQILAYLEDDLYMKNAHIANEQTRILKEELETLGFVIANKDSYANILFVEMGEAQYVCLKQKYPLYYHGGQIRIVTSFDTTEEDRKALVRAMEEALHTKEV